MTKRVAVATVEEVAVAVAAAVVGEGGADEGEGVVGVRQWIRFGELLLLLDTSIRQDLGKFEVGPEVEILLIVEIQPGWL